MYYLQINNHLTQWTLIFLLAVIPSTIRAQTVATIAGNGVKGFSGDGATPMNAKLSGPSSVWRANNGSLYIADTGNHRIRHINTNRGTITTIAGTGVASYNGDGAAISRNLNTPTSVVVDGNGNIYLTDTGNHSVRRIDNSGNMTTVAGTQVRGFSGDGGLATSAQLNSPTGLYIRGDTIYVSDSGNNRLRSINGSGIITTIAGNDTTEGLFLDNIKGTKATLKMPRGIFVDIKHNVYIADSGNHRIRFLNNIDGQLSTFAGTGVPGFSGDGGLPIDARLSFPSHVLLDDQSAVYIADRFNQRIRQIIPNRHIRTISGDDIANFKGENAPANRAQWKNPTSFCQFGDTLFVIDQGNNRIRTIVPGGTIGPATSVNIEPGGEAHLFSIAYTGDGKTSINGVHFTASDLQTATGFEQSDVRSFNLYENDKNTLTDATQIGLLDSANFSLGIEAFVSVSTARTPEEDQTRYYILSVVFSRHATQNHAMRISAPTGALSTNVGGYGTAIAADDTKAFFVNVNSTKLSFQIQPQGSLSGHFLKQQPTVYAIDENGLIDYNFSDTVAVYTSGSGTLFGHTAIAKNGKVTFTSLRYDTESDDEKTYLIARNVADNKYDALESPPSELFATNVSNDPPVIQLESSYSFIEDDPIGITLPLEHTIFDEDEDELSIKHNGNKTEIVLTNTSITMRPFPNLYGLDTLTITARDDLGLETSKTISIQIQPVNDYPAFSSFDTLRFSEDDTLSIPVKSLIIDTDNALSELETYFSPSKGLFINNIADEQILKLWTGDNTNGLFAIDIETKDLSRISQNKQFMVLVEPKNDPPNLTMKKLTIQQGYKAKIDLKQLTTDIDSAPPNLYWTAMYDSLITVEIDSEGNATLVPSPPFHGKRQLVFTAHNQDGKSSIDTLDLVIKKVNSPPILSNPDTLYLSSNETLHIELDNWVNDKDDSLETLNWSFSELPGAIIEKNVLTWIPPTENPSSFYILKLLVKDPHQKTDSGEVTIILNGTEPLLRQIPTIQFSPYKEFNFDIGPYMGPQADQIILDPSKQLTAAFDTSKKSISIQAINGFKGNTRLNITAESKVGRQLVMEIPVIITNPLPTINTFPDIFLRAGELFRISLDHFAVDDEPVDSLTWSAMPESGLQVSIHTVLNTATVSANNAETGLRSIDFTATDRQGATARQSLNVMIHESASSDEPTSEVQSNSEPVIIDINSTDFPSIQTISRKKIEIRKLPDITLFGLGKTKIDLNRYIESSHKADQLSWRAHIIPNQLFTFEIDSSQTLSISANSFPTNGTLHLQASDNYGIATTITTPIRPYSTLQINSCDFDRDGLVDLTDFFILADVFGQTLTDSAWNPNIDIAPNGKIDFDDFFLFAESFGKSKIIHY
ncbi:MAG: hypothetical protein VX294_08080 [Candidatus Latescibacterota bacterium]|nr:hypothetical protein [Candidatus Latescibacterota bacterium]